METIDDEYVVLNVRAYVRVEGGFFIFSTEMVVV